MKKGSLESLRLTGLIEGKRYRGEHRETCVTPLPKCMTEHDMGRSKKINITKS